MLSEGGVFKFQSEISSVATMERYTDFTDPFMASRLFVLGCLQEEDTLALTMVLLGGGGGRKKCLPQSNIQRPEQLREVKVG